MEKIIRRGAEFYNPANGYTYRILGYSGHFTAEATDEMTDEGENINFKPCNLTYNEVCKLANAKSVIFED